MVEPTGIRWGNRFRLDIGVRVFRDTLLIGEGCITNASTSGAYVETPIALLPHSNIRLQPIRIGGNPIAAGAIHATVSRLDAFGVGVEWRDMACPEVIAILSHATRAEADARAVRKSA